MSHTKVTRSKVINKFGCLSAKCVKQSAGDVIFMYANLAEPFFFSLT